MTMQSRRMPLISLLSTGMITFNAKAREMLGHPRKVELLYNDQTSVLGIRARPDDDPAAIVVGANVNGVTLRVMARDFCKFHMIQHKESAQYAATLDVESVFEPTMFGADGGKTLIIDLSGPVFDPDNDRGRLR